MRNDGNLIWLRTEGDNVTLLTAKTKPQYILKPITSCRIHFYLKQGTFEDIKVKFSAPKNHRQFTRVL